MPARQPESLLLLVRHGSAEDAGALGDAGRALTDEGRRALRAHAAHIAPLARLERIATSPLVRAVQTAEILAQAFGVDEVVARGELALPHASPETIAALARELGPGTALVGHNPSLAETVPWLLGQGPGAVTFRAGAAMAFAPRAGTDLWDLRWVAEPG